MNRLSKTTRKEIYQELIDVFEKALKYKSLSDVSGYIFERTHSYFLCHMLGVYDSNLSDYPEFTHFKPTDKDYKENRVLFEHDGDGWFELDERRGFEEKLLVLCFCLHMVDDDLTDPLEFFL
jgi:hypothetical protein